MRPILPTFILAILLVSTASSAEISVRKVKYNRDIRPILANNCYQCHGPDEKHRKADLRLDIRKDAMESEVIVPGNSSKSELYLRLTTSEKRRRMPPAKSKKTLKPREIALIKQWIDEGAEFQGHWAYIRPQKPALPRVKNNEQIRGPLDFFIQARLEREALSLSSPATKETIIRRLTFDLTGLPPTMKEVRDFLADHSPDAYEKVVDRLLASPQFGEHQARYWLDAVRYGDTHGLHLDNYREIWPYRDWVIRALNSNKRFDRFTVEQLAGDLLPNPTLDQLIASGYNRAHVTTSEGGSIAEEVYVRNVIDRVSTTSTVWMGLTAGCAVCHDHKFDPLTQKEMYQLFAFFNNLDANPLDGNRKDHAPVIRVPTREQERQLAALKSQIADVTARKQKHEKEVGPAFQQWLTKIQSSSPKERNTLDQGLILHYALDETTGTTVKSSVGKVKPGLVKGSPAWRPGRFAGAFDFDGTRFINLGKVADFERDQKFSYGAWINWSGRPGGMAPLARMNDRKGYRGYDLYIANGQVAVHLISTWPSQTLKVTSNAKIRANKWTHLFVTYDGSSKPEGLKLYFDGKPQPVRVDHNTLAVKEQVKGPRAEPIKNSIRTKVPLYLGRRNPGSRYIGAVDDVRIYDRQLSPTEVANLAGTDPLAPILAIPPKDRTPKQKNVLRQHYLNHVDPLTQKLTRELTQKRKQHQQLEKQLPTTLVMKERQKPREAFILVRGEYDKRGAKVSRATPKFLPPMNAKDGVNRLGFARWLVSPEHPMTARVNVNRYWQQLFGTGIVKTSEDFGIQGEWPSHPDLLDWLAVDFRESGWNIKRLFKQMVMSGTYRQSSKVKPEAYAKDPQNRLLARGPRFRLDAEMLRDQALALSGLLVNEMGGASVKPPQPLGLWRAVGYTSSNTARFKPSIGENIFRRSVYTFWKRTSPPPQMVTFDAPSRESCTLRRERTNTPLQALLLMNERQYVESARHLAQRMMLKGGTTPEERATYAFHLATARKPGAMELAELVQSYKEFHVEFSANEKDAVALISTGDTKPDPTLKPGELAAWTMVANLILNLDEVLNKE